MNLKDHNDNEDGVSNNSINTLLYVIIGLLVIITIGAFYLGQNINNSTPLDITTTAWENKKNNEKTSGITIKIIDDSRCWDCNTNEIINKIKQIPALSSVDFIISDFSNDGIEEYLRKNSITMLPAIIFNRGFIDQWLDPYLQSITDWEYSLQIGAKFNPFIKRSEKGFLQLDLSILEKIKENSYIQGNANAWITWIEYSDLECPFCARLHNSTTPKDIKSKYGEKLNVVFNHFPLNFHKNAQKGAETLECIGEVTGSDTFYTVIEKSYKKYDNNNFDLDGLFDIAANEWVNKKDLANCVESGKYSEKVMNQMSLGQDTFGVTGTPWNVLINNKTWEYEVLSGAYPSPAFEDIIDRLLSK